MLRIFAPRPATVLWREMTSQFHRNDIATAATAATAGRGTALWRCSAQGTAEKSHGSPALTVPGHKPVSPAAAVG
jgi:hypothetical protein